MTTELEHKCRCKEEEQVLQNTKRNIVFVTKVANAKQPAVKWGKSKVKAPITRKRQRERTE